MLNKDIYALMCNNRICAHRNTLMLIWFFVVCFLYDYPIAKENKADADLQGKQGKRLTPTWGYRDILLILNKELYDAET